MKKNSTQLLNVLINIVIPVVILVRFSTEQYLGPIWGIIIALAFPISYGIWELRRTKEYNLFSVIGVISIFLTGSMGVLKLPPDWIAIKEAGVPLLLGVLILLFKKRYPFVEKLLHEAIDYKKVHAALEKKDNHKKLKERIEIGTYIVAGSFFLSSFLNFLLAKMLLKSAPGTEAFAAELGKMTALSFPVIALPSMIVMMAALIYIIMGIMKFTGLEMEEIVGGKKVEKAALPSSRPE